MKRFLVNFILGVSAVCAGADEIADISNADLKIADNVRLELHRQMDTSALLKALQNEKRPEIRDGILYSLACMTLMIVERLSLICCVRTAERLCSWLALVLHAVSSALVSSLGKSLSPHSMRLLPSRL
jgi:hypothetical protein